MVPHNRSNHCLLFLERRRHGDGNAEYRHYQMFCDPSMDPELEANTQALQFFNNRHILTPNVIIHTESVPTYDLRVWPTRQDQWPVVGLRALVERPIPVGAIHGRVDAPLPNMHEDYAHTQGANARRVLSLCTRSRGVVQHRLPFGCLLLFALRLFHRKACVPATVQKI